MLKHLRIQAGFPTPDAFANTIDMPRLQYAAYEAGKTMELSTFKRILFKFGVKIENWLNMELLEGETSFKKQIKQMLESRLSQVISQAKEIDKSGDATKMSSKIAQRHVKILINCHVPRSRTHILEEIIELEDSSYNTFKRVAGKLLDYGWLDYTNKANKNSPNQPYYTTEEGVEADR